jgi:putative dimethyl sulfoxide reductase chaperone
MSASVFRGQNEFQSERFRLLNIEMAFITKARRADYLFYIRMPLVIFNSIFHTVKGIDIIMQPIITDPKRSLYLNVLKTLCRIFWGPDLQLCQDIMTGNFVKLLQDASDSLEADLSSIVKEAGWFAGVYEDAETLCATLNDGYIALFINDINAIPAPLYHSCYLASDSRLMGPPAMDMRNRIERHGLSISLPGNEPTDHLCIELEYLYYLLNKGWSESCSNHILEAIQFAGESMVGWVCRFRDRITADGRFPFYAISAQLLSAIVRNISELTVCSKTRFR